MTLNPLLELFWIFIKVNLLSTSGPASVGLLYHEVVGKLVTESQFANSIGLGNASYSFNQIDAWDFTQIKVPITLPGWVDTSTIIDILPEKPIQLLKNKSINSYNPVRDYMLVN